MPCLRIENEPALSGAKATIREKAKGGTVHMIRLIVLLSIVLAVGTSIRPHYLEAQKAEARTERKNASAAPISTPSEQKNPKPTPAQINSYAYYYNYPADKSGGPSVLFQEATTVLLILFTGGLLATSFLQWRTYEAQKELQRQQMILANGPQIQVREVALVRHLEFNEAIEVSLSLINMGNSKATIISGNFTVLVTRPDIVPWVYIELPRQIAVPYSSDHDFCFVKGNDLEAGMQSLPVTQTRQAALTPGEETDMKAGTKALWVIGHVFYQDDLSRKRKTGFCRRFDLGTKRFVVVDDPDLEYES
jgi:hypothetical protein